MKKLILSFIVLLASIVSNAQEPEKKKDSRAPSRGQERAINEIGISVKSETKKTVKTTKTNSSQPASKKEPIKADLNSKAIKKP